ncbi:MAG: hypothetical protein MI892_30975 [Desulfobacterales bacterium]|nr:hypothetical protein [Desulfobacterales bacterium]
MKHSFILTMGILSCALGLMVFPIQGYIVQAQSYGDEQYEEQYPNEQYQEEQYQEDPYSEDQYTDDPYTEDEYDQYTDDQQTDTEDTYPLEDTHTQGDSTYEYNDEPVGDEYPSEESPGYDYDDDPLGGDVADDSAVDASSVPETGTTNLQAMPPQCQQAAGSAYYRLTNAPFGGGYSYLQPNARMTFDNQSSATYNIRITPSNIVSKSTLTVPAGHKKSIFVSSSKKLMTGNIIANAGSGDMYQGLVKCP